MTDRSLVDGKSRVDAVRRRLRRHGRRSPLRVAAAVAVVGLLLTALSTWATARVDFNTERRLLQTQTKQAAAVLTAAILLIERPLTSTLDVQRSVSGDPRAFTRTMAPYIGADRIFISASLWQRDGGRMRLVESLGVAPAMKPRARVTKAYLRSSFTVPTFRVRLVTLGTSTRVAYAEASKGSNYVVYAERAVPADRRAPSDRNSAFADLHYATYLGTNISMRTLATTDLAQSDLPIDKDAYSTQVPFGDTQLTIVASARRHLGGDLSQRLPVILLFAGLLLTALASRLIYQVTRSRQSVESDAATISSLYQRVDTLYGQQRDVSERLQRALLPPSNPVIPHLEVASDYVAGAQGVDIGGDWYSIVRLDEEHFAFVVGDVSGRGVDAVAVMARARFTLRAYLVDGNPPDVALQKAAPHFDLAADGHFTTVLVGVGNNVTGEITLANAGHPPPLLLSTAGAGELIRIPAGTPLGVGSGGYRTFTFTLEKGATLVAYTDGLVERRGEDIDLSLDRLITTAEGLGQPTLDGFVNSLLGSMLHDGEDDVAVLVLRRRTDKF